MLQVAVSKSKKFVIISSDRIQKGDMRIGKCRKEKL